MSKARQSEVRHIRLDVAPVHGDDFIAPVRVERSPRRKRISLEISEGPLVVLKLPLRTPERHGFAFLHENAAWVRRELEKQASVPSLYEYLSAAPFLSMEGRSYQLFFEEGRVPGLRIDPDDLSITFRLSEAMETEDQIVALLRRCAELALPVRVLQLAVRHEVRVHGVTVRDQKTRWGSCSETGSLSLNWRLLLLREDLQDHVLLHELAHLRHFDHSAAFHAVLRDWDPRAQSHKKALREEGALLMQLGRSAG